MTRKRTLRLDTRTVHGTERHERSHSVPIDPSATYGVESVEELIERALGKNHIPLYSRLGGNPTVIATEQTIANLEKGQSCMLTASGMAAVSAVALSTLKKGEHAILIEPAYSSTAKLFHQLTERCGIRTTFLSARSDTLFEELAAAVMPKTRLLFFETPTNPTLDIIDIRKAVKTLKAKNAKALVAVDNSFASPYNQRPIEHGADLVVHSTTKYLNGHGDLIGGAVVFSNNLLIPHAQFLDYRECFGPTPSPRDAYELLRGIKTLSVRVAKQNENAAFIARVLRAHPAITELYYPGSFKGKQYAVAVRQMRTEHDEPGFGGMISFRIKGGKTALYNFLNTYGIESESFVRLCASLGYVETILQPAALLSHRSVSDETKTALGIHDELIRLSVGIEDPRDIVAALELGLKNAAKKK